MTEYTSEENQELIETIKGPRFYHVQFWGYGGEAEYIKLTKEQFEFWNAHNEEHGDSCLLYTSPSPRDQRGSRMPSSA